MTRQLLLLFVAVCLAVSTAHAQKGIQFRAAKIGDVFKAAKQTGKPVFVEVFSPTCHVCQSFMPTLENPRVGSFYNSKFISTRVDIGDKAIQAWLESRKLFVPSLPLFLYFDPNQSLIHFAMSNNSVEEVVRHGTNALTPAVRSQGMKARYAAGERSANFLIDYGMYARVTRDTTANIKAMEDYARQQSTTTYASNTNWLVMQKLVMDLDNPMFQYLMSHPAEYKSYDREQVKNVAENILMSSLYSARGAGYSPAKILQVKQQLIQIGIDPKVATNRTLLPEVNAYFRQNQTAKAVSRMDGHVATNPFTTLEYLYISRLFNRQSTDASDVPTVVKWLNKALTGGAVTPKEQADLYFELAEAHRRGGKVTDANKAAQKSMEMAQMARLDTRRNVEQMAKLK
ncbi:MAG: DUF255 domain-containing protein [Bacteroidetes bacterium]|nr:DUF255 domain-containing protein [Fibrella sp.]